MQGVDSRKLEHILNRPWSDDGKTFTARCWEGCDSLVSKVNRELFRMVATGEAPDRAIEAIAKAFGTSKANAGRVVMTESAAIASQAQHDCYTELGVEEFEVIGTFDSHMCDFCGEMDGQHFPEKDRRIGENAPPFHPWCRCTTAPYDEDMKDVGYRWMRDPETGKGGTVPSDMVYPEWKAIFVDRPKNSGIIKLKNSELKNGLPQRAEPHSIIDKTDDDGKVLQRRIYGDNGKALIDYDVSDHNRPDKYRTGAHKHVFDYSKKNPHGKAKPLIEKELEQNSDIIRKGENYHDPE